MLLEPFEKCQNEFDNVKAYSPDIFLKINKTNLSYCGKQLTEFTAGGKNSSFEMKIKILGKFESTSVSSAVS